MAVVLRYPLVCIVGPTASGKTNLAQAIAERLGAAVLSADSMQVYRGMDIGTGKIAEDQRTVDYYGIDLVEPGVPFSAALFQDYGRGVVESLDAAQSRCIVCGGTGFYIRALVDDFDFPDGEQVGNDVRDAYTVLCETEGPGAVWTCLHDVDPASASLIPVNDTKRVIRALELYNQGCSYAEQKERFATIGAYYEPLCMIGLSVEPDVLAQRIEDRVDAMLASGLVGEVEQLLEQGYRCAVTASQAIGYKEIVQAIDGLCTLEEAVISIKTATRQYAKRQRTWFRKDKRIQWLDATENHPTRLLDEALDHIAG